MHLKGVSNGQYLGSYQHDPAVCGGKPCIRGTRIWVSLILDLLATGMSEQSCAPNIRR